MADEVDQLTVWDRKRDTKWTLKVGIVVLVHERRQGTVSAVTRTDVDNNTAVVSVDFAVYARLRSKIIHALAVRDMDGVELRKRCGVSWMGVEEFRMQAQRVATVVGATRREIVYRLLPRYFARVQAKHLAGFSAEEKELAERRTSDTLALLEILFPGGGHGDRGETTDGQTEEASAPLPVELERFLGVWILRDATLDLRCSPLAEGSLEQKSFPAPVLASFQSAREDDDSDDDVSARKDDDSDDDVILTKKPKFLKKRDDIPTTKGSSAAALREGGAHSRESGAGGGEDGGGEVRKRRWVLGLDDALASRPLPKRRRTQPPGESVRGPPTDSRGGGGGAGEGVEQEIHRGGGLELLRALAEIRHPRPLDPASTGGSRLDPVDVGASLNSFLRHLRDLTPKFSCGASEVIVPRRTARAGEAVTVAVTLVDTRGALITNPLYAQQLAAQLRLLVADQHVRCGWEVHVHGVHALPAVSCSAVLTRAGRVRLSVLHPLGKVGAQVVTVEAGEAVVSQDALELRVNGEALTGRPALTRDDVVTVHVHARTKITDVFGNAVSVPLDGWVLAVEPAELAATMEMKPAREQKGTWVVRMSPQRPFALSATHARTGARLTLPEMRTLPLDPRTWEAGDLVSFLWQQQVVRSEAVRLVVQGSNGRAMAGRDLDFEDGRFRALSRAVDKADDEHQVSDEVFNAACDDLLERKRYAELQTGDWKTIASRTISQRHIALPPRAEHKGGFSYVYRGRWQRKGQAVEVAVKIPKPFVTQAEKVKEFEIAALEKIENEVRNHQQNAHPHVVKVHGMMLGPSRLGIVMEWCESNLAEFVAGPGGAESQLAWADAARIVHGAALGLQFLHEGGFVHRDVKPENILLLNGSAKLADFGLSERVHTMTTRNASPRGFVRGGTQRYMAPEVLVGGEIGMQFSDVYSFGVVLGFVATRGVPWGAWSEQEFECAMKKFSGELHTTLPERKDWQAPRAMPPRALVSLWSHCCSPSPDRRPSMLLVGERLERLKHQLGALQLPIEWLAVREEPEGEREHVLVEMDPDGEASGPIRRGICGLLSKVMPGCEVAKVELNCNAGLFKQFKVQREHVAQEHEGDPNEKWLWHGCRKQPQKHGADETPQEQILRAGFMLQKGNLRYQYYGRGTYFAPDPRLSHHYAASAQNTQLILSRVVCGRMVEKESVGKTAEEIRQVILLRSLAADHV